MQSWEWTHIRREQGKTLHMFAELDENDRWVAVYGMTLHPIPHTAWSLGYIPKSAPPTDTFIAFLRSYLHGKPVIFVKFEPHTELKPDETADESLHPALRVSPHPLFTRWNQVLDLQKSQSELMQNMHHKTRYNIKLAVKKGVSVMEMSTPDGYAQFESLYFETCKRQKYKGHTPSYHRSIWNNLGATNDGNSAAFPRLTAHIVIAQYEGTPLVANELWQYKDTLYYVYGGSSAEHRNVMAPNALMWHTIQLAQKWGCTKLDMWGSLPPQHDEHDPWAGFTKFKDGYGTRYVQSVGTYDLVFSEPLYLLYSAAHIVRQKLLAA